MDQLKAKQDNTGFSIYHSLMIDAELKKVFQSISEPQHLINWWPEKCTGVPEYGSAYNFYFSPEYDWFGTVSKCIPNTAFYIKMTKADEDWEPTSFGFDISELDNMVYLDFWHKGWPNCNSHYKTASFCWAMLLKGLKNYVEAGIVIPFQDRE